MEDILKNFAKEYDLKVDKMTYIGDTQRSVNNPILFLFIGDKVTEAYEYIKNSINKKWDNANGIVFFGISTNHIEDTYNSFNFKIDIPSKNNKTLRKDIRDKFYSDKSSLAALNVKLTMATENILSSGNLFNSFENINISLITSSSDPLNVILPEITALVRKKLLEVFKLSTADLYILVNEKNMSDEVFERAVSVSFFREVEYFEKDSYKFEEDIDVYEGERELKVTWNGPLFYLTYVLEEKNEKGMILKDSMANNYEIIAHINFIKNRNLNAETYSNTENQYYDNNIFKSSINYDKSLNRYASAGFAKVTRPNSAIAVSVVRAFCELLIDKMDKLSDKQDELIRDTLKIDEISVRSQVDFVMPKGVSIDDMNGIMMNLSKEARKKAATLSLRQIEEMLYEDRCKNFFLENFDKRSKNNIDEDYLQKEIRDVLNENVLKDNKLGLYCAFNWTSKDGKAIKYIRGRRAAIKRFIGSVNDEIENIYATKVSSRFSIKNIFGRGLSIEEFKRKLFQEVYAKKLDVLRLDITEKILAIFENTLLKIHEELLYYVDKLNDMCEKLRSSEDEVIKLQDEYTAQNVKIYYTDVVNQVISRLETTEGELFYLDSKYTINVLDGLKMGNNELLKSIVSFCNDHILNQDEFKKSFENEFNDRCNVNITDSDSKAMSKDELYRKLYDMLNESSALKIYLMNYDVKPYIERYFLGDHSSDFIKYAFGFDRKTRSYKIGYIDEIESSSIEKLNLMGGFAAKDIIYIRNSMEFYNYCIEKGYMLHGIDVKMLPEI